MIRRETSSAREIRTYVAALVAAVRAVSAAMSWSSRSMSILLMRRPDWGEPRPRPESLLLEPGRVTPPDGDWNGNVVDEHVSRVKIGRRSSECIRRIGGGGVLKEGWCDEPAANTATEEYFLLDGRLLLWRRHNGMSWSRSNPRRAKSRGAYELLVEADTPVLEIFGHTYRLWYDQIPEYAL